MTIFSNDELASFREAGYLIKPDLFTSQEVDLIKAVAAADPRKQESNGRGGAKHEGRRSELWSIPGTRKQALRSDNLDNQNLLYDAICYCQRMHSACEQLLIDETRWPEDALTLHHRKFVLKDRESFLPPDQDTAGQHGGNGFQWHQDYWYWGDYTQTGSDAYGGPGRPYPDLVIALLALDRCHRDNGCLQVISGSHKHRLNFKAEQWGERHAIPEEVDGLLSDGHEQVYCEMEPGSVVFFSPETLHRSFPNSSEEARWVFICCYDTMHNAPNNTEDWRVISPVWHDDLVLKHGRTHLQNLQAGRAR